MSAPDDDRPLSERPLRELTAEELFATASRIETPVCTSGREPYDLTVMDDRPPQFSEGRTHRRRR